MSHARLAPSSAGRWVHCPGSAVMEEQFPDSGAAADAGEASHWVASECLRTGEVKSVGTTAPNGVVLDDEMVSCAMEYVQHIMAAAPAGTPMYVECPLSIEGVHPECFGTPDTWYATAPFRSGKGHLHVWDYKYGWLIVDAFENWQLICYAIGALEHLGREHPVPYTVLDQQMDVTFHIVQPRPHHVLGTHRTWTVPASDLRAHANILRAAAEKALGPNPQCVSGAHCRFCKARHACSAAQQMALAAYEYTETASVQQLDPAALARELAVMQRAADAIKYRLTGLEAQAAGLIQSGVTVPGWTLDTAPGRAMWSVPTDQVFALGDLYGRDLRKQPEAITPAQARKLGLPGDIIEAMSSRGAGEPKLVQTAKSLTAQIFRR